MFANRREAGRALARLLAAALSEDASKTAALTPRDIAVLGLPRGGVPVAYEIARALGATLDVFLVRKLGTPGHPELAMGAIASGGIKVLNDEVVRGLGIRSGQIDAVAGREQAELERREAVYRHGRPLPPLSDKTVVLVDDGLATGSTMKAAVLAARRQKPARVIVAVPVGAPETCRELRAIADQVICAETPTPFSAVGQWYQDFTQTSDEEVIALLSSNRSGLT